MSHNGEEKFEIVFHIPDSGLSATCYIYASTIDRALMLFRRVCSAKVVSISMTYSEK